MSAGHTCTAEAACRHLSARLNEPGTRSKGFRAIYTVNVQTKKMRLLGIAFHKNASDKGLMLNTCPWCGAQPGYFERAASAAKAAPDMLAALIVAREFISTDRNSFADCAMPPHGPMDPDDAECLAEYDAALLQIDAAIQKATPATPTQPAQPAQP